MPSKILVTGCGRAGTQYTARLLNLLGIPCGHERVYTHAGINDWDGQQAESSWLAAPLVSEAIPEDCMVWHQLRDPLKVVRCWNSHRTLTDFNSALPQPVEVQRFVFRHLPECSEGDDLERCVKYVLGWTRMLMKHDLYPRVLRYRLERLSARSLLSLLFSSGYERTLDQVETAMEQIIGRIGACVLPHVPEIKASRIVKLPGGQELLGLYHQLGYSFNLSEVEVSSR